MRRTVVNEQQSRPAQSEVGQSMVEFALTITFTLMLIFGLIECSRAIYTASVIQWAAQQGARAAIVDSSYEVVEAAVKDRLVGLDLDKVVIPSPVWSGSEVEVEVNYSFEFVVPLIERITGDSIQMHASASMVAY